MACCSCCLDETKITFLLNYISRKSFDLLKTMSLNTLHSTTSVWRRQSGNRASSEWKVLPVCLAKRYARMAAPRWCTRYYLHDTLQHCAIVCARDEEGETSASKVFPKISSRHFLTSLIIYSWYFSFVRWFATYADFFDEEIDQRVIGIIKVE